MVCVSVRVRSLSVLQVSSPGSVNHHHAVQQQQQLVHALWDRRRTFRKCPIRPSRAEGGGRSLRSRRRQKRMGHQAQQVLRAARQALVRLFSHCPIFPLCVVLAMNCDGLRSNAFLCVPLLVATRPAARDGGRAGRLIAGRSAVSLNQCRRVEPVICRSAVFDCNAAGAIHGMWTCA